MSNHSDSRAFGVLQVSLAGGGQDEHPILKPEISIGRARDNDFVLHSRQVSAHHLRLTIHQDGSITVMDLGTLNGTRLNDQPLPPRKPSVAQAGDAVQVDLFTLRVRFPSQKAPLPPVLADRVRLSSTLEPCLAVFSPGGLTKHLLTKPVIQIGRGPDNDIVIPFPQVSRHHARLQQSDGVWIVHDLGSASGLVYNGQRVQQQVLRDGDVVYLDRDVALQLRAWPGFVPTGDATGSLRRDSLYIKMEAKDAITVGRAADSDIVIDHPQVSRYHTLIERMGTRCRIRDLKSANGVYVNGRRIEGEAWLQEGDEIFVGPVKLRLAAGGVEQVTEEGVRLDAMRLKKWVTRSKNLLQDISLSIYPREFVAFVGLSGAGKTTLMDAINGFRPATEGTVLVNGINLYRNFDMFRNDMGYVPQQNIVHADLTVYKALDYAAQLRMPADTTARERQRRIVEVMHELDLAERKDLVIRKLSGGQLKRVSIGVELLTKPRLFFLDEPTSGLDPGTEYNMMRLLRRLADQGRTIVLVTHATKNVMMCDKVLIIIRGGYVAFYGPPEEALTYFDRYRTDAERRIKDIEFDDTYIILEDETRGRPEDWDRRYRQSAACRSYVADRLRALRQEKRKLKAADTQARKRPRVNTLRQFFILTRRYMELVMRDRLLLFVLLAVMPLVGALLLLISQSHWLVGDPPAEIDRQLNAWLAQGHNSAWYGIIYNSRTLLFIMGLAAVLLGLFSAGFEIVKEWSIYQRERLVILRILPYLASKVVVLGTFALVQCLLLILVVSLKVDMPKEGVLLPAPAEIYITLILGTLAAIMMGLFISALVPNQNTVIYILFVVLFFQMIFAGVIFNVPGFARSMSNLTLSRWTMEGLGSSADMERLNGLTRTRFQAEPITREISVPVECPGLNGSTVAGSVNQSITIEPEPMDVPSGTDFQISFEPTSQHMFRVWLILVGFVLLYGLGTTIVLRLKDLG